MALPINREDGGQTQLQTNEAGISSVQQQIPPPTYPAMNIPEVITQDFFNPPPSADRQRVENELQQRRQEYTASFTPTAQEEQLAKETMGLEDQLTNLRQSEEKGAFDIQQQRIAMPLITGQEAALRRQGQLERGDVLAQLESKQRSYGYEVEKRKGLIERGKALLGFAESDVDRITAIEKNNQDMQFKILEYAQGLREESRQVFGTILKSLEGKRFDELSPEGQQQIAQMAAQAGLPLNAVITGLDAQADQKDIDLKKQDLDFKKFGLDVAKFRSSEEKADEAAKFAEKKFAEDKRQFGLKYAQEQERIKITRDKANTGEKLSETELKDARGRVSANKDLLGMAQEYKGIIEEYGFTNRLFGNKALVGKVEGLRANMIAAYKKAKTLGTLDQGVLDLMDMILGKEPTSGLFTPLKNIFGGPSNKIISQMDTLIGQLEEDLMEDNGILGGGGTGVLPEEDINEFDSWYDYYSQDAQYLKDGSFNPEDYY